MGQSGVRLAAAAGLSRREQGLVRYVSLLAWVGCVLPSAPPSAPSPPSSASKIG